jgi:hypothetical protein
MPLEFCNVEKQSFPDSEFHTDDGTGTRIHTPKSGPPHPSSGDAGGGGDSPSGGGGGGGGGGLGGGAFGRRVREMLIPSYWRRSDDD